MEISQNDLTIKNKRDQIQMLGKKSTNFQCSHD